MLRHVSRRGLERVAPLLIPVVIAIAIVLVALPASDVVKNTITTMLINLILVVGLYTFVGNSGVFSFVHVGFMAIGAYTSAILTIPVQQKAIMLPDLPSILAHVSLPTPLAVLIAGLAAAVFALVFSLPLMRISTVTLPIASLALLVVIYEVTNKWDAVTRGGSLLGIPTDTTMVSALPWVVVALVLAFLFQVSRFGLRLRACREEEVAARALGIGVTGERTFAFVLSAFMMGTAGALYGHQLGSLFPGSFYFAYTFLIMTMLVVGGRGSLAGAFVGTVVVSAVQELLRRAEGGFGLGGLHVPGRPGLAAVVLAVGLLLILAYHPKGLMRNREFGLPHLPRRRLRSHGRMEETGDGLAAEEALDSLTNAAHDTSNDP